GGVKGWRGGGAGGEVLRRAAAGFQGNGVARHGVVQRGRQFNPVRLGLIDDGIVHLAAGEAADVGAAAVVVDEGLSGGEAVRVAQVDRVAQGVRGHVRPAEEDHRAGAAGRGRGQALRGAGAGPPQGDGDGSARGRVVVRGRQLDLGGRYFDDEVGPAVDQAGNAGAAAVVVNDGVTGVEVRRIHFDGIGGAFRQ